MHLARTPITSLDPLHNPRNIPLLQPNPVHLTTLPPYHLPSDPLPYPPRPIGLSTTPSSSPCFSTPFLLGSKETGKRHFCAVGLHGCMSFSRQLPLTRSVQPPCLVMSISCGCDGACAYGSPVEGAAHVGCATFRRRLVGFIGNAAHTTLTSAACISFLSNLDWLALQLQCSKWTWPRRQPVTSLGQPSPHGLPT